MSKILILNLGGTSSKVAVYDGTLLLVEQTLRHTEENMRAAPTAREQLEYRKSLILAWLAEKQLSMSYISAVAVRGATIKIAAQSGTYLVTGRYKQELMDLFIPDKPLIHGNRVVTPLALALVGDLDIPIYITDPSSVNEMSAKATISGVKGYQRRSRFHALNQKMVARKHAEKLGRDYRDCRFVVAHLGGGISIGAHESGRVTDANDAGDGYGPFSADRAGTVSTEAMLDMCYGRSLSQPEVYALIRGGGGLISHLGTGDLREVEAMADGGNEEAALIHDALVYQIAKEIGAYAAVLKFDLEAILLTGGMAYSQRLVNGLKEYIGKLAPVEVYAGEFENEALAAGACRVLSGQEEAIIL
ncbi:MAG: butyrate kinase [Candidatus Adiutrix sp.]|nr:butyrate kinase [Candidatus Adiutrix sp.]